MRALSEIDCPECGYSLTGLAMDRCPECGAGIDGYAIRLATEQTAVRQTAFLLRAACVGWLLLVIFPGALLLASFPPAGLIAFGALFALAAAAGGICYLYEGPPGRHRRQGRPLRKSPAAAAFFWCLSPWALLTLVLLTLL